MLSGGFGAPERPSGEGKIKGQNPKKSIQRRSAEGVEARDFFIPCGAEGASKTRIQYKNTNTEEAHESRRSS